MRNKILFICLISIGIISLSGCDSYSNNTNSSSKQTNNGTVLGEVSEAAKSLDEGEYFKGPENAKVTIVEMADFECPACRGISEDVKKITDEYKDKVKYVFLHYPLSYHKNAEEAALATEAAGKQGKFWEMYDKLWAINTLNSDTVEQAAKDIGLDMNKFEIDRNSQELKDKIARHKKKAESINLQGTPTFFINSQEFTGNPDYNGLKSAIDQLLK